MEFINIHPVIILGGIAAVNIVIFGMVAGITGDKKLDLPPAPPPIFNVSSIPLSEVSLVGSRCARLALDNLNYFAKFKFITIQEIDDVEFGTHPSHCHTESMGGESVFSEIIFLACDDNGPPYILYDPLVFGVQRHITSRKIKPFSKITFTTIEACPFNVSELEDNDEAITFTIVAL